MGRLHQLCEHATVLQKLGGLLIDLLRYTTLECMLLACVSGSSTMQFLERSHVASDVYFCCDVITFLTIWSDTVQAWHDE